MNISRISSTYMMSQGVSNIQQSLVLTAKLQERIASGSNLLYPSDDPVGLTQLLQLNRAAMMDQTYINNVDDGLAELKSADNAITGINEIIHRAIELNVQGANGIHSQTSLDAIEKELSTLIDQAVLLANSSYNGHYIFSGFKTDTPAYSKTGSDYSYDGTPLTEPYEREVEVARNTQVAVNVNGEDLLGGSVTVVAGPPNTPPTITGNGLLASLLKLKYDLVSTTPPDFDAIRTNIQQLKDGQTNLLKLQTDIGSRINQMELIKNRAEDRRIVLAEQIQKIQEIDMPGAISDLNFQQTRYQTSLGVMSKIMQTSLVNFLR